MKRLFYSIGILFFVFLFSLDTQAQFLKKLKEKVEQAQNGGSQQAQEDEARTIPENYDLKLTGSGSDLHLSYRMDMEMESTQGFQMDMNFDMYIIPEKGGRTVVNMNVPVMGKMTMITLTHFNEPDKVYILNERKKQYAVLDADEEGKSEHFSITKIGNETLHGLSCVHGKATDADGQVFEFWTTKEVPEYQKLLEIYSRSGRMGSYDLWQEMKKKGTAGLMVKMLVPTPEGSATMELTKMEKTDMPNSMLEIPSNYKESKGGWVKRYQNQMQ